MLCRNEETHPSNANAIVSAASVSPSYNPADSNVEGLFVSDLNAGEECLPDVWSTAYITARAWRLRSSQLEHPNDRRPHPTLPSKPLPRITHQHAFSARTQVQWRGWYVTTPHLEAEAQSEICMLTKNQPSPWLPSSSPVRRMVPNVEGVDSRQMLFGCNWGFWGTRRLC